MTSSHDTLSSVFGALNLSDGKPDKIRRKAELSAFLDTLEPWELWHVRAVSKEKLGFADLPSLPVEIIGLITEYLDHYDIAACAGVCKSWSSAFKRDDVVRYLLTQQFPGILQTTSSEEDDFNAPALYQRLIRQRALRQRGKFAATLVELLFRDEIDTSSFTIDQESDSKRDTWSDISSNSLVGNDRPARTMYSHGRIVWELADNCTIIDTLATLSRHMIIWPKTAKMILYCLGDELLVMANSDDQTMLTIYHLETRETREVQFPGVPSTLSTRGKTLCAVIATSRLSKETEHPGWPGFDLDEGRFIMFEEKAYLWAWDEYPREPILLEPTIPKIDTSSPSTREYTLSKIGAVYHPSLSDVLYLICFRMGSKTSDETALQTEVPMIVEITARKYVDGKAVESFNGEFELDPMPVDGQDPFLHLHFVPANAQGNCSILSFHHPSYSDDVDDLMVRGSVVYFDTVSERFSVSRWPAGSQHLKEVWFDWDASHYETKPFIWDGMVQYHLQDVCVRFAHMTDEKTRSKRPGALRYLPLNDTWLEENDVGQLWGDDKFLVLAAEKGYTVWTFDEEIDVSGKAWQTWDQEKEGLAKRHKAMEEHMSWMMCEDRARRYSY